MKGLIVFSFGLRDEKEEPNPCNIRLAKAVKRIVEQEDDEVVIVAQWEVARALESMDISVEYTVELCEDGSYLGSETVWEKAVDDFNRRHITQGWITEVIPVAQPFLQLTRVKKMIRAGIYDYRIVKRKVGWIGFDRKSTQWWTRDPIRLLIYAVLQQFTGRRGHAGKQHAS